MVYAEVSDLEARWRTLTEAERARAASLLADAALRIDVHAPLGAESTVQELQARLVVSCNMVQRSMAAGDGPGLTQGSETAGPFSASWTSSS